MRKRFLQIFVTIFIFLPTATVFAEFPTPTGFVNDFANVIKQDARNHLESLLNSFENATGNEIAVVTLPSLEGRTVEDIAVDLYKTWGIGKKGKDNGVLFVVAPNERKMRIEVGYGLEGVINDALAGRILDEAVVPQFKAGNLDAGIAAGTIAIVKTIVAKQQLTFDVDAAFGAATQAYTQDAPIKQKTTLLGKIFRVIFIVFLIILFIRHPWLFLLFLSAGRGGGSGGFGGGFGGFGGGFSGGGGASRSW